MNALYNYRIANHIPMNAIADFLGIDREFYPKYESGEFVLDLESLEKLADLYGIDLMDLYDDKVVKNSILRFLFQDARTVITENDLREIAKFRRVIKEYEKMEKLN
ncbi:MAG: helix-turn-helix transcriptional regulator [Erysipelotrichales bacterium]|nr:helix-turn-helix transcriptional regulator [Erysipelotrichales bacterium]